MNKIAIGLATVALFFAGLVIPLQAAPALIFEGKVTAADGKPVPAAEVRILNPAGKVQFHVFSDLQGQYRFPVLPSPAGAAYRMELSHLRYQPVKVEDAVEGARIGSPGPADMAPGRTAALLAATKVVRRDFVLTLSRGTPQHPTLGPIDPNFAEYCYQQALLLVREDKRKAVELFKVYAQTGFNPRQIARSLEMIALHDR